MLDAIKDSFVLITSCFSSQSFENPIFLITDCVYMDLSILVWIIFQIRKTCIYGYRYRYIPVYMMNISTLLHKKSLLLILSRDIFSLRKN